MYKKTAKDFLLFLARFSPVLFIVGPLFFHSGYVFFTDFVWGPHIALDWASQSFFVNAVAKGLSFAFPIDLLEKMYIALCLGLALWGGRKVVGIFLKGEALIFAVSLFALFNPFIYDRALYGQFGMVGAVGLMLLGIGFLMEYWERRHVRQIIFAGVSFAFAVQFAPQFIFFIAAFYLAVFLPVLFIGRGERGGAKALALEIGKISLILALIALALNANWIIGEASGTSATGEFIENGISAQDLAAFQTSGTTGADALGNVLMMSGFWGKDQSRYADLTKFSQDWGRSFFLLLPLILWGFIAAVRSKEKKYKYLAIGSALLFIVAIVLAAGIRIPVGREVTYFLFNHLPFYKGLREPQKWVSVAVAVYLIFLSLGVRELFTKKIVQRNSSVMKLFIGAVIVMQAPLLLFGFNRQVPVVPYPSDWYAVDSYIAHDSGCAGSTLFLPWHLYMSFGWIGHIVANPAPSFFKCPIVSGTDMEWGDIYDNSQSPEGRAVAAWLATGGEGSLLTNDTFDIRYVILAKEVDWESYAGLGANPELKLVMETPTLKVYKVVP